MSVSRRRFVTQSTAAVAAAGLADFAFLNSLPRASAAEGRSLVALQADIEPLVKLIEDTPREKILDAVAEKVRKGTSYGQLLAATLLAGVRGIQPRPVGFKFHAVLVVNSAHQAALFATDNDRWLPLFWAIDNFKGSQARNKTEGDWRMSPVDEAKVPAFHNARQRFTEAMDAWDEDATDAAVASLTRNAGAAEVIELFWRYGARDFRDIGHKAIYVANAWRTLQTIGWRHAEPVMRSLAYALLDHGKEPNPAKNNFEADVPGRENLKRANQIRKEWQRGTISADATTDLLSALRSANAAEASEEVVKHLNKKIDPASVWDALFLTSGELLMRQPGIAGLHCVTMTNAMYHGYQATSSDETRRYLTLQTAAFLALFRKRMEGGKLADVKIDKLEKEPVERDGKTTGVAEVFRAVSAKDKLPAARKTLGLLEDTDEDGTAEMMMKEARRLIFAKGNDSHDYKFSSAALEDYYHVTSKWRLRFLASSVFWLKGADDKDTGLLPRTRAALSKS